MTNYLPESYELYREFPFSEGVSYKPTGTHPPKSDSKNPREDRKTLLDKILGILK
jgi:hypothetical protein